MKSLIIVSLLGVAAMITEALRVKRILIPLSVLGLTLALFLISGEWNADLRHFNDMVYFDNNALAFSALIILITIGCIFLGFEYYTSDGIKADQVALLLFAASGALVMTSFSDLTMFFIGLEILSISIYVLAASNKSNLKSNEAGMKYFLLGAFATGFLLFGIALIYGACGSFNLVKIASVVKSGDVTSPALLHTGILLVMSGLLFKVSAAPFHFWSPDVYEGAPTPITAFMATAVKTAAFAAFYRLFSTCFATATEVWTILLVIFSAATMLLGNIMAVVQTSLKRMLAYSSIAHAGYLLMAVATMNEVSGGSILYYTMAYSLGSIGVFVVLFAFSAKGDESINSLRGLYERQPIAAVALSLIVFSLAGIPPMAGFFAKYYIFYGALMNGNQVLVMVAIISSLIGVYYYFRMIYAAFSQATEGEDSGIVLSTGQIALLTTVALSSLVAGLFPDWIQGLI